MNRLSPAGRTIGGFRQALGLNSMPFGPWLLVLCLRILARLPLGWLRWVGAIGGRAAFALSRKMRDRMLDNVRRAGIAGNDDEDVVRFARAAATELGKSALEILPLWFGRVADILARVRLDSTWDAVQPLLASGKGVIFLTPHLGGFEVAGQFLAHHMDVTIMYRKPKIAWLDPVLRYARAQGRAQLATADMRGVRASLKALKRGEAVGMLPDQVPAQGAGVLADFFGRPAYTTTLIGKLQQATGAPIVVVCARRLPDAVGFEMTFHPMPEALPVDDAAAARALNAFQEDIIRRCPEQYLWSYNRFKVPVAAPPQADRPPPAIPRDGA
jgi:Kdo2-lipid IVA lauroyltransferase/acyltransferase